MAWTFNIILLAYIALTPTVHGSDYDYDLPDGLSSNQGPEYEIPSNDYVADDPSQTSINNILPPPPLICRYPEKKAVICGDTVQETCWHGRLDGVCNWQRSVCVCAEGYVRGEDYEKTDQVSGACFKKESCRNFNKLRHNDNETNS